jgi:hypothetical protein
LRGKIIRHNFEALVSFGVGVSGFPLLSVPFPRNGNPKSCAGSGFPSTPNPQSSLRSWERPHEPDTLSLGSVWILGGGSELIVSSKFFFCLNLTVNLLFPMISILYIFLSQAWRWCYNWLLLPIRARQIQIQRISILYLFLIEFITSWICLPCAAFSAHLSSLSKCVMSEKRSSIVWTI